MTLNGGFEEIPLQGAYAARQCPVVSQLETDTSLNVVRVPLTESEQARVDAGIEFERSVFESIINRHQGATVVIEADRREDAQRETVAAMASEANIILRSWLPDDPQARRTGRPDVLLRVERGWVPVDAKYHGNLGT